ncbi:hypothetical protein BGZ65_007505, partial [Modicella reniformis]
KESAGSEIGAQAAIPPPPRQLEVDSSQPTTSNQIRMDDRTRMMARFNLTRTVNDIRGFINASSPGESTRSNVLQTNFPKKDLEDVQQTIEEAGLANAWSCGVTFLKARKERFIRD